MKHLSYEEIVELMGFVNENLYEPIGSRLTKFRQVLFMAAMYSDLLSALEHIRVTKKSERWPMNEDEILDYAKMFGWKGK